MSTRSATEKRILANGSAELRTKAAKIRDNDPLFWRGVEIRALGAHFRTQLTRRRAGRVRPLLGNILVKAP